MTMPSGIEMDFWPASCKENSVFGLNYLKFVRFCRVLKEIFGDGSRSVKKCRNAALTCADLKPASIAFRAEMLANIDFQVIFFAPAAIKFSTR